MSLSDFRMFDLAIMIHTLPVETLPDFEAHKHALGMLGPEGEPFACGWREGGVVRVFHKPDIPEGYDAKLKTLGTALAYSCLAD